MAAEAPEQTSGVAIPDLHGAVLARRGDPPAVGAEGHGTDVPTVPFEGFQLLTGLHVPDLDGVPFASRHQAPAVRAERDRQTISAVLRADLAGFLFLLHIPQVNLPVAARRSQVQAVGAERHPPDPRLPVVGAKRADRIAGPRVPDLHGSVRSPRD